MYPGGKSLAGACIANIFSLSVWLLKFSFLCHPADLYLTDLHGYQISPSAPNSPPSTFLLQRHKCHDATDLKGLFFVPSCGDSCCCQCPFLQMLVRLGSSAFWPACCRNISHPPALSHVSLKSPECFMWAFPGSCSSKPYSHSPHSQPHRDMGSVLGLIFLNPSHLYASAFIPLHAPRT